jgi:hypothetical protein
MNTLLYSIIGIICLIAISYLFSRIDSRINNGSNSRLNTFRRKLALTANRMRSDEYKIDPTVFRRTLLKSKLHIFPANGDRPVL